MNILIIVDKEKSAIWKLAKDVEKYNPHHKIFVLPVHPKRPSVTTIENYKQLAKEADILDFQYWKTALMLLDEFPEVISNQRLLLQHHNPYSIGQSDWKQFDKVITNNETIKGRLFEDHGVTSDVVYNSVDIKTYEYKDKYKWNGVVGMVAGRIESSKGIKEVADICKELGYKFLLVGRISDRKYFNEFGREKHVEFREDITEKELRQAYHDMGCLVVNSKPDFESGPMPPLEAMASGIPVVSNMVGTMKDVLRDGNNSIVHDRDNLKEKLANIEDRKLQKIRANGWELAKGFDSRRRARQYSSIYYRLKSHDSLVSVIIPTADRPTNLVDILSSLSRQTYEHFEVVIADDGNVKIEKAIDKIREKLDYPIKYVPLEGEGYQLAKARNMAVIEAEGDFLMFLDDRLRPDQNAINAFVKAGAFGKEWLFGNKGADKKNFVENFSFIKRKDFIEAGMFNERMDRYGGMSQEIRTRFRRQNFQMRYINFARCEPISGTHKTKKRRKDIIDMKFRLFQMYYD